MINSSKKILKNKVYDRFLPIPETVLRGLEREPQITDFTLLKELGVGSFGRVLLVQHNKTQAQYAIKAIDKRIKDNIEEKPYFRREMEIMYRINHPNVVKLFGHFEDNTYCYFIMEYIPRGNLYSLVPKRGIHKISNHTAVSIIKDVISALYYLHHMNPPIIHRDIKPENILVSNDMRAKLTDFGWSNYLRGNYKRTTICGTPIYLAPEVINNTGHDEKIDIWCVGVLIFELLTGEAPWEGEDVNTVKNNILRLNIKWPKNIDKDAKDLISKILKYMPEERPRLRTILSHPFFLKYYPDAVNCLQTPNSIGNRLYIISKDHPLTFNEVFTHHHNYSEVTPTPSLAPYNGTKTTIYSVTPIKTNNVIKTFTQSNNNGYIIPPTITTITQTNYHKPRNTYTITPIIKNLLPKENFDFNSTTNTTYPVTKINNQNEIIRIHGYSHIPRNTAKIAELIQNEERIRELVRKTKLASKRNYANGNNKAYLYQTQYKTYKPIYYSDKNLNYYSNNSFDNNYLSNTLTNDVINKVFGSDKYDFSITNNRFSNINNIDFGNHHSFRVLNDPDILRWKEQERLRRESERVKLSSLMNRYGMDYIPSYSNHNYNFI